MGVILDTSVLISLEKSDSSIDEFTAGREDEPFGIRIDVTGHRQLSNT